MASSSSRSTNSYHVRSISLPCRSHPTITRVEEEIKKLKTSETISNGLSGLAELYECTSDLLGLSLTQQALSHHQQEKWVDDLLDGSVKLLDVCGSIRDAMSQMKEHARGLQSAIRRKKADLSIESSITKFTSFRKKMNKKARRLMSSLKQIKNQIEASVLLNLDQQHLAVIKLLREVGLASISIFQSLVLFFSVPKGKRWSLIAKLIRTERVVSCEEQMDNVNELESLDAELSILLSKSCEGEKEQNARRRLAALEDHIEGMESSLECLFRRLIKTRASFLNIASR